MPSIYGHHGWYLERKRIFLYGCHLFYTIKRVAARRIFWACFAILFQGDRMETIKSSAGCKLSASGMRGRFVQSGMGGHKGARFRFEN